MKVPPPTGQVSFRGDKSVAEITLDYPPARLDDSGHDPLSRIEEADEDSSIAASLGRTVLDNVRRWGGGTPEAPSRNQEPRRSSRPRNVNQSPSFEYHGA
jgi:hypothetical protein